MAETPEAPENENEAPALTAPSDFLVPNQDLFEQVIDRRLAAHSAHEESSSKTAKSSRTTSAKVADKS